MIESLGEQGISQISLKLVFSYSVINTILNQFLSKFPQISHLNIMKHVEGQLS